MLRVKVAWLVFVAAVALPRDAGAESRTPSALDRTVVRWVARGSSGDARPHTMTARELAFEARIEALSEGRKLQQPYADSHVRAAIQRHITEEILSELPVDPQPTAKEVGRYAEDARLVIEQQVGGRVALNLAANAEGITAEELNALLRRRARASYYLDKMVAPMLQPSDAELRDVHRRGDTPFTNSPYAEVEDKVRNWYVSIRLRTALDTYYRGVRSKVTVQLIDWRR